MNITSDSKVLTYVNNKIYTKSIISSQIKNVNLQRS